MSNLSPPIATVLPPLWVDDTREGECARAHLELKDLQFSVWKNDLCSTKGPS